MDYPRILEDCRNLHQAARADPLRPALRHGLHPGPAAQHDRLFANGYVAWGAIVKANRALYQPGANDLAGCALYSFDHHFDDRPEELEKIARAVMHLYNRTPADESLRPFAAVVSDDHSSALNQFVPQKLSHGREVRYEVIRVQRDRLPASYIAHRLVPVVIAPALPAQIMLLPLACWSPALVQEWDRLAADRLQR